MKKRLCAIMMALALCAGLPLIAEAAETTTVVLKIRANQMAVGTDVQQVDDQNAAVVPVVENGRTLVPVSRIVSAFGGSSTWDGATRTTSFTLNGKTVYHTVGSNVVITPSGEKTMEASSKIINSRTYVPMRYVLEGLGLNVEYESTQRLVVVSTKALDRNGLLTLPGTKALLNSQKSSAVPASNYTAGKQIAPARSKASMEPKYDSATVQKLDAATGFFFTYTGGNLDYDNFWYYAFPDNAADGTALAELRDYVTLLSSQPGFRLTRSLKEYDDTGEYVADLIYTGSDARMKGTLRSEYSAGDVVHVEIVYTDWYVTVSTDENLKYEDKGLRTKRGAAVVSSNQISGSRVGDAYYLNGGSYYNASDKKLSAASGKAALLIDGQAYAGKATFNTWINDRITISDYYRSDVITVSLPTGWAATGDVYGLGQLRYGKNEDAWDGPSVSVEYDAGKKSAAPLAEQDQQVTEATVRVLRWDKSGGDTVIYFHMKAEIQGKTYDIEGLAAAPWTDSNGNSAGSGSDSVLDKDDCSACNGSGRCRACGGTGRVMNSMAGTGKWLEQDCRRCSGSGTCQDCHGTGKK